MLGIRHWSLSVGAAVALLASASTLSAQTTKSDPRGKASNAAGSDPAAKGDADAPDQRPQGPWNDPAAQLRRLKMMVGGMPGGPGGPGGGRGGPGGPGGPGGTNGTNGMVTLLLASEALQEEIALTDEQKAKLQEVRETADKARREMFTQMRNNGGQQGGRGGNNGGQAAGGNRGGNNQARGGRGGNNINFQAMGEMMAQLNQKTEASIGKILDKAQKERLNQIELRIIGVTAVARADVAKKLNVTPPQSAQIQAVMDQMQAAQREQRDQMMQQMRGAFGGQGGQGGRGGNNGQPGGGRGGNAEPNAGGNENNGGGRGNRPDFNSPEMREMMTKMTDETERMEKEVEKGIAKVLTKNQKAKFNSMLGADYDLTKLAASLGGNRGGRGGDRTQARNGAAARPADGDR